ncbi:MAG: hypothetical protein A2284_14995 [Deltaproteobacteria bacterium RIFOXYA12_FULL_61_11]|nr:MAG: hypothetical protein A2284_14995 [Deltaproteobacteria bacterium RIFOXYA12_FULL_61_11]
MHSARRGASDLLLGLAAVRRGGNLEVRADPFSLALGGPLRKLLYREEKSGRRLDATRYSTQRDLLLGDSILPFVELKATLDKLGADIRVLILDSCFSGVLIKGGTLARENRVVIEHDFEHEGDVVISSSTYLEPSMESDELQSSYFSYFLMGALRGEGDLTGDGLVSVREAYQYVYDRTLLRTSRSAPVAQHPRFSYHYKGSGDVILTDLRKISAVLVLPALASGPHLVYDKNAGYIVLEVDKVPGRPRRINLEPGDYLVRKVGLQQVIETDVTLAEGEVVLADFLNARVYPYSHYLLKRSLEGVSYRNYLQVQYAYYHLYEHAASFNLLKLGFQNEFNRFSLVNALLLPLPSFGTTVAVINGVGYQLQGLVRKTYPLELLGRTRPLSLHAGLGLTVLYHSSPTLDYDQVLSAYTNTGLGRGNSLHLMPALTVGTRLYLRHRLYFGSEFEFGNRTDAAATDDLFRPYFSTMFGLFLSI